MKDYLINIYVGTYCVFYIIGCISTLLDIAVIGNQGEVGTAIIMLVFFWVIAFFKALLPTLLWGTVIALIAAIPTYIYKKIKNKPLKSETDKLY